MKLASIAILPLIVIVFLNTVNSQNYTNVTTKRDELSTTTITDKPTTTTTERPEVDAKENVTCLHVSNCKNNAASCYCDKDCVRYRDCCFDSPYLNVSLSQIEKNQHFVCDPDLDVSLVNKCYYQVPDLIDLCLDAGSPSDPLTLVPFVDLATNITYKNINCARCNPIKGSLEAWKIKFKCSKDTDANIDYDEGQFRWHPSENAWFFHYELYSSRCDIQLTPDKLPKRSCSRYAEGCASDLSDYGVAEKCHSYLAPIKVSTPKSVLEFRNHFCATCNYVSIGEQSCFDSAVIESATVVAMDTSKDDPASITIPGPRKNFSPSVSFTFLIDFSGPGSVGVKNDTQKCDGKDVVWDRLKKMCRNLKCIRNSSVAGKCNDDVDIPIKSLIPPKTNSTNTGTDIGPQLANFSTCDKSEIDEKDFEYDGNGTIKIISYGINVELGNYYIQNGSTLLVCTDLLANSVVDWKFPEAMNYISTICIGLSMMALILHLIIYFTCLPKNLPGHNLASLSVALLVGYGLFMIVQTKSFSLSPIGCRFLAVSLQGSFLASFFWMNVIAVDVTRVIFIGMRDVHIGSSQIFPRFFFYSIYAWSASLIISGITYFIDSSPLFEDFVFNPKIGRNGYCWFISKTSLAIFFVAPLAIILTVNFSLFAFNSITVLRIRYGLHRESSKNNESRQNFLIYLRLFVLMGLTWVTAFLANFHQVNYLYYVFVISNASQGVAIFISFTLRRRTLEFIQERSRLLSSRISSNPSS